MELDPEDRHFQAVWDACEAYTMMPVGRALALFRAVRHIHQNFIQGDIVECGVWRGGGAMVALKTLQHFGLHDRRIWLFDTFSGTTAPTSDDVELSGATAEYLLQSTSDQRDTAPIWGFAALDEVRRNVLGTGYPADLVEFVEGDVAKSVLAASVGQVALLRLDTDFHDSTRAGLELLFPRVVENGVIMIDGFGRWFGARKAVNDYFDDLIRSGQVRPMLHLLDDQGGVLALKPKTLQSAKQPVRYDYHAPGLKRADLLRCFPEMVERDISAINWIYLRSEVPHIWRSDARAKRQPDTGAISVEEAELLFNNALPFSSKRGLEVGCHYGWSTAHLVRAGLDLDVIDPALGDERHFSAVHSSLTNVGGPGRFHLWPGYSPGVVQAVHATAKKPYSFAFIDGFHEGPAPREDAVAVAGFMATDACVMFHDLTSPYVSAALTAMEELGWNVGIYNTMQIMGVAWRGNFKPVEHIADPNAPIPKLTHLIRFKMLSKHA